MPWLVRSGGDLVWGNAFRACGRGGDVAAHMGMAEIWWSRFGWGLRDAADAGVADGAVGGRALTSGGWRIAHVAMLMAELVDSVQSWGRKMENLMARELQLCMFVQSSLLE
jgi:hypothetical protein